jgi:DNA helicase-2/ATP-dependent DNA helicase PcrA
MAVTFTNKAAREMRERLYHLLGRAVEELTLGTFHAICVRILRREGKAIGLDPRFVIYDEEDQLNLLKRSLQALNLDPKQYPPRAFKSVISAAKSQLLSPNDYAQYARSYFEEIAQRVFERYQLLLAQSKALDFDDLIMTTELLFRSQPEVLDKYQSRYVHLLIDEFQDTNIAQYALSRQLAEKYRNICVVGDPDQSIYSWRFADLRNILSFEKHYPEAKVVFLEQSYRSSQTILYAAHRVISINKQRKEKNLWTENEMGSLVSVVETYSEEEEAQFVVSEIERLVSQGEVALGDCAVMYRTNAQSRAIEEMFVRYGVPYQLVGATRFYQRREIKDTIAYLKLIYNPYDSVSLTRIINVPGRGIGQRTLDELSRWTKALDVPLYTGLEIIAQQKADHPFPQRAAQVLASFYTMLQQLIDNGEQLNVVELLDFTLQRTGYKDYITQAEDGEERWDNILELRTVASQYQGLKPSESLDSFLEVVTLVADIDDLDEKKDMATLITLHQAKGLEFPAVFIVGMEEGISPHFRSFDDPAQMEEERRLCYVGMTRAKKHLYLVHAFRRHLGGRSNTNPRSRFIEDIPVNLMKPVGLFEEQKVTGETSPSPFSFALLTLGAGDRVRHASFGEGVVLNCTPTGDDQEVVVDFEEAGKKKLLLSLAPLERVN